MSTSLRRRGNEKDKGIKKKRKRNTDDVITTSSVPAVMTSPLGVGGQKGVVEEGLEALVFGSDRNIIANLSTRPGVSFELRSDSGEGSDSEGEEVVTEEGGRKVAWVDESDQFEIKLSHPKIQKQTEGTPRGDELQTHLRQQFTKITGGTPSWAKLQDQRPRKISDDEQSDDEEDREFLRHARNYLSKSESLPRETLDLKRCTDVNKACPTNGRVMALEFHPAAKVLLTAGLDQSLNLFQVDGKNNPKIQSVFVKDFPIYDAHFSRSGEEVVMVSNHRHFFVYDMIGGSVVRMPFTKDRTERYMRKFTASPDGQYLVFLGRYGYIHMMSSKSKEIVASLKMNGKARSVAFTPDGSTMMSFGDDGDVYVWDMNTRDCIHRFTDHGCVQGSTLALSPDCQYLACGSHSGIVNIYDNNTCHSAVNPTPLRAVSNLLTPITRTVFNSHSDILAISSSTADNALRLVHVPSQTVFKNFPDITSHLGHVTALHFSPNSGYLSVGNNKGHALLYRLSHYTHC